MRLDNVRLLTDDFGAAFGFYADALGLPVRWGDAAGPYAEFEAGGAALALFDRALMAAAVGAHEAPAPGGDATVVVLRVDDVDAAVRSLREREVAVGDASDRPAWGIRTAHLRDPDGHLIELAADLAG